MASPAQITQPTQAPSTITIGMSTLFMLLLVGLVLLIIVGVVLFFFVKWVKDFIKNRDDFLFRVKSERMRLCGIHSNRKVHNFRVTKNTPIRLVHPDSNGKMIIEPPLAYYGGHYISSDASVYIKFMSPSYKLIDFILLAWLPLYEPQLLLIPSKKTLLIEGKAVDVPETLVQFNDDEILIHAYGIDTLGERDIFCPVLKDKNGLVIDMKYPIYEAFKSITMAEVNMNLLSAMPSQIRAATSSNPLILGINKVSDTNNEIPMPQQSRRPEEMQR